jgi:uncharacterized membrane protein
MRYYGFDWVIAILGTLLVACLIFIGVCVYYLVQEEHACTAKGGQMVGNGHYYSTVVMVGKTPIPMEQEEMECSK